MSKLVCIAIVTADIQRQLALHRAAIDETGLPIIEATDGNVVRLWAPEELDVQLYRDALERLVWQTAENEMGQR